MYTAVHFPWLLLITDDNKVLGLLVLMNRNVHVYMYTAVHFPWLLVITDDNSPRFASAHYMQ